MSRLPLVTYDETNPQQRALWDEIVASRGGSLNLTTDEGRLAGPFEAFIMRPELGQHLAKVGGVIRFQSSLDTAVLELAIATVGARWKSEFEFWAHSGLALAAGVDPQIIDDLANGRTPVFAKPTEATVYDYTWTLSNEGRVEQALYDETVAVVGLDGIVDLTQTIGYYTQICFILNAFNIPLPTGIATRFNAN